MKAVQQFTSTQSAQSLSQRLRCDWSVWFVVLLVSVVYSNITSYDIC